MIAGPNVGVKGEALAPYTCATTDPRRLAVRALATLCCSKAALRFAMNPLQALAPVAIHSLLASTEERKHALAAHVKYHIGEGRVRAASGKHIRSLAKIWPAAGRAGQAAQETPQQARDRARTHEPCAPA